MKIAVAGTGYVGLSIATLLAQHHEVVAVDIIPEKVELINNKDKNLFITFSKKIIQATCSIKYIFTKHGLLKILIIWKGTVEGFLQYNKFKKYILEQIKII